MSVDENVNPEEVQSTEETKGRGRTRLDVLKTAGVVAGAAVAGKLASAADGQPLVVAANNSASNITTGLTTAGFDAAPGLSAFKVTAPNFDYGISGEAQDYGVFGTGAGGVLGLGTVGGVFSGSVVAINLDPQAGAGAPTGEAFKGDLAVDSNGILYLCVADGTPGTWIRVSHGGTRLLATPQRAYSSTDVGTGVRMNKAETRTIQLAGVVPGVPSNALGIVLNLTVHQTINAGFVTAYPAGTSLPATSTIDWFGTGQAIANGAIIGVGSNGAISFYADGAVGAGQPLTQIIVDVTGYIL
jgi:hypothetical protein